MFERLKHYFRRQKQKRKEERERRIRAYKEAMQNHTRPGQKPRKKEHEEDLAQEDSQFDGWFGAGDIWFPEEPEEDD